MNVESVQERRTEKRDIQITISGSRDGAPSVEVSAPDQSRALLNHSLVISSSQAEMLAEALKSLNAQISKDTIHVRIGNDYVRAGNASSFSKEIFGEMARVRRKRLSKREKESSAFTGLTGILGGAASLGLLSIAIFPSATALAVAASIFGLLAGKVVQDRVDGQAELK